MEKPKDLPQNPSFSASEVTSAHMDEPFMWLNSRAIESVTIDGHRLVSVDHVDRSQDGTLHIVCSTEAGASHLFEFNPLEEGPVTHLFIGGPNS